MKISLTSRDAPSVEVKYGQLSTESLPTKHRHRVKQIGGVAVCILSHSRKSGNENLNPKLAYLGQSLYFYNKIGIKGEMA
jgi:hypothetical protein